MNPKTIRVTLTLIGVFVLNILFSQSKHGFVVSKDIFGRRVFIENKGQFDDILPSNQKIKYAYVNEEEQVYFNHTGLTYLLQKNKKLTEHEREELEHGKKINLKSIKKCFVHVSWENSNSNIQIIESELQPFYHSFGDAKFKSNCYKKITYKNVYNNIDIEYVFTPEKQTGIKYNVILHPGANIKDIKIKYSGDLKKLVKKNGNVIIKTAVSNIIELAPISYQNGTRIGSKFKLNKNTISFELPNGYDTTKELIIDPWVTNLSLNSPNYAYDVDYDYAGNYYVYGGGGPFLISKYTSAGVLVWTFNGLVIPISWLSWGLDKSAGNFVVDKRSGKSYTGQGFSNSAGTRTIRLDVNGIYDNFVTTANPGWTELWDMGFDCNNGTLFGLGGSTTTNLSAGIIDTATSAIIVQSFTGLASLQQDVVSHAIDPSGTIFLIFASMNFATPSVDNHLMRMNTAFTGYTWLAPTTYTTFVEYDNKHYPSSLTNSNGYNALAANDNYLYYYDGFNLAAYNKLTGAQLGFTTISGLTAKEQGGIAVDACDNVYIGGNGSILCFNFNGTTFTANGSIPVASTTPDKYITDIKYYSATNELFVCGSGFGGIYTAINSTTCNDVQLSISTSCPGAAVATLTTNIVNPVISYSWTNSNGTLISQTTNTSSLTNTVSSIPNGTYTVFAQIGAPCGPATIQTLTINCPTCILPVVGGITGNTTICTGSAYTYSVAPVVGATSYSWTLPNGWTGTSTSNTISALSGIGGGTISVTVTNTCGISLPSILNVVGFSVTPTSSSSSTLTCNTNTVLLSTSGAVSYTWSGPGIVSGATTASVTVNSAGIYTVTATDANGCTATTTIAVSQNTVAPIATASNTGTLTCTTTTLSLTGTGGGTYSWSGPGIVSGATTANPIVNLPGVYSLTVTGTNGCSATASSTIVQNTITPSASASNTGTLTCTTATLSLTGTGGGTYSWSGPGVVSGATTANPIVNLGGVYSLTVTSTNGCSAVASTTVVQSSSTVTATANSNNTLSCSTSTVSLTGTGGGTYSWSGPGIVSGATSANPVVNLPGVYSLTVTDVNGCSATANCVVVQSFLTTTLTISPDVIITAGSQTQLNVTGNGSNYTWSPATNLSCTTCTNPIANPVITTTYCVLSSLGTCTAQACVLVTVKENCDGNKGYGVPNAFSPNGDGYNDEFCLQGWEGCVTGFSIKIYNRWGEKVYEATDETFCWDGTFKGKLLDPAVFVFYIEANSVNLGSITKKGNITLIK